MSNKDRTQMGRTGFPWEAIETTSVSQLGGSYHDSGKKIGRASDE